MRSLPPRERGLKPARLYSVGKRGESLPPRERGLKRRCRVGRISGLFVAPSAGAWIETPTLPIWSQRSSVAPSAGAWIETNGVSVGVATPVVAPSAGAWIETSLSLWRISG